MIGFSLSDAQRIAKVVKRVERQPQNGPPRRRRSGSSRPTQHWIGKADSEIESGVGGTISVWAGEPGSETDTSENLEAFNRTGLTIDEDAWCKVTAINGHLYVEPWECPE